MQDMIIINFQDKNKWCELTQSSLSRRIPKVDEYTTQQNDFKNYEEQLDWHWIDLLLQQGDINQPTTIRGMTITIDNSLTQLF